MRACCPSRNPWKRSWLIGAGVGPARERNPSRSERDATSAGHSRGMLRKGRSFCRCFELRDSTDMLRLVNGDTAALRPKG